MSTTDRDRDRARKAATGDAAAFRALVDAWSPRVLGFCRRMVRDRGRAEDLAQEVFVRLYEQLHRFDPDRPFGPWMRRVMAHHVLNALRRKRHPMFPLDGGVEGAGPPADPRAPDPLATAGRRETAERVRAAIADLRPDWRAVIALRYTEGLAIEEIADALDLPPNTVKTRLFRARAALRTVLTDCAASSGEPRP